MKIMKICVLILAISAASLSFGAMFKSCMDIGCGDNTRCGAGAVIIMGCRMKCSDYEPVDCCGIAL